MTEAQAKQIGVKSARKGRKRAKDLLVRVVSYFIDSYTRGGSVTSVKSIEHEIKKALLDVNHPARSYHAVDAFIESLLRDNRVDGAFISRRFAVRI